MTKVVNINRLTHVSLVVVLVCSIFQTVPSGLLLMTVDATWSNTGGGDHNGADWTPSNGDEIAGVHTNIGTFTVAAGTIVYLKNWDGLIHTILLFFQLFLAILSLFF